ncbi:hypothetical protein BCR44DRAFT_36145 [Catenaria anguillulae PL171]|uniref:Uncharacterized protein n=1 Tax=Catenaria anguillulae PL171 TaxID=765915 RepID=A0A1Y2HXS1_9FUNG|nr:hypothetical protein BCR44DRAFT_1455320 [Catenaria anguillulae PL171]ORZ39427.1 hypothetical protein BCR44DRAFT_36145 [Catenaria anguillulae PL171]
MSRSGLTDRDIMSLGRWRDNAVVLRYTMRAKADQAVFVAAGVPDPIHFRWVYNQPQGMFGVYEVMAKYRDEYARRQVALQFINSRDLGSLAIDFQHARQCLSRWIDQGPSPPEDFMAGLQVVAAIVNRGLSFLQPVLSVVSEAEALTWLPESPPPPTLGADGASDAMARAHARDSLRSVTEAASFASSSSSAPDPATANGTASNSMSAAAAQSLPPAAAQSIPPAASQSLPPAAAPRRAQAQAEHSSTSSTLAQNIGRHQLEPVPSSPIVQLPPPSSAPTPKRKRQGRPRARTLAGERDQLATTAGAVAGAAGAVAGAAGAVAGAAGPSFSGQVELLPEAAAEYGRLSSISSVAVGPFALNHPQGNLAPPQPPLSFVAPPLLSIFAPPPLSFMAPLDAPSMPALSYRMLHQMLSNGGQIPPAPPRPTAPVAVGALPPQATRKRRREADSSSDDDSGPSGASGDV